jgi:hypothetical protein
VSKTTLPKHDELIALTDRAQQGDRTALPALRELLEEPDAVDRLGGDLARLTQQTLIDKFTGDNLLLKESVTRKLELLRAELAGPNPAPLERLLVDRILSCWLHVHHLEQVFAQRDGMSLVLGIYYQRSITSAHKRYLAAIKVLAVVRRLALPALQVNIAQKQHVKNA